MPSMHVGWALWCGLVIATCAQRRWVRIAGWAHPVLTVLVVVGTGNHWILDVVLGWALVIVAMWLVDPWFADSRTNIKAKRIELHSRLARLNGPIGAVGQVGTPAPAIESIPESEPSRKPRPSDC
jgi:membrane-associated phospholipid phosphatase